MGSRRWVLHGQAGNRETEVVEDRTWVGVNAGKAFHWAHVLDACRAELLSRRAKNDEADLSKIIDETLSFAENIVWAVDQPGGSVALLLALMR